MYLYFYIYTRKWFYNKMYIQKYIETELQSYIKM